MGDFSCISQIFFVPLHPIWVHAKTHIKSNIRMKKLFLLAAVVLALPMMAQDEEWRWSQEFIRPSANIYRSPEAYPDVKAIGTPQSLAEVVAAMPAVPTVEIVYNPEVKEQALRTTYMPFEKAMAEALFQNSQRSLVIDNQIKAFGAKQQKTNQKAMAQYNANVNAGLMPSQQEMMEMMMSGEIDPNWPEAKIMDAMAGKFAAKWGVSKEEYLKIMNLAQKNEKQAASYLQTNHPDLYNRLYAVNSPYGNENVHADDPRDAQFGQIGDQLSALQEQLNEALGVYSGMGTSQSQRYGTLTAQMDEDWKICSEAREIDAIEAALDKRVEMWYRTIDAKGDVPYPDWWTAERKRINAIVDKWNRRWAEQWMQIVQDGDTQLRPIMQRAAELETENENLGKQGTQENFNYLMNKKLLCAIFAYLPQVTRLYDDAFNFPCLEHVEETGNIIVEK